MAAKSRKLAVVSQKSPTGDAAAVRARILEAFSARARQSGIRAVLMGELAAELRMSAMTLYKHFASKNDLVVATVDAWADDLAAIDALEWDKVNSCASALEVLARWADAWTASLSAVSPAFFEDLRRDYPESWRRFHAQIGERKLAAIQYLVPYLREDVNAALMLQMLDSLVMQAADPRFVDLFGVSRREAVRAAISVWGGGALRRRAKLRPATPPSPLGG